jgi:Fur family transcriptional regulator, ferric uptake regulator
MAETENLTNELRSRGFRITPQRTAILGFLNEAEGHVSPAEIYEHVSQATAGVTETTVYRTLEFLEQNDMVHASLNRDGHLVYQIAGRHHDHLICRSCGASVEIDHDLLEGLYQELEEASGYELTGSHLTFFGLCPDCRSKKALYWQPEE